MRFHAILPLRDEADIIGQCLTQLLTWVDAVYLFDTGSVDDSWEIVQEFAARDKRVIPLKKDAVFFSETHLRGWMFNQARTRMRDGDWFLRVDADEFHHIPPPEFVATEMRPYETIAYHQYYDFRLTESEVKLWESSQETAADRSRPIQERRRWFTPSVYSEPRLCKYRATMQWPPTVSFPFNAGFVARARLPIRHYPHRDPLQLSLRCKLRAIMMADRENRSILHWSEADWRNFIARDDDPALVYWRPGTDLTRPAYNTHLAKPHIRLLQRVTHQMLLPILDRSRPTWPNQAGPRPLPEHLTALLKGALTD